MANKKEHDDLTFKKIEDVVILSTTISYGAKQLYATYVFFYNPKTKQCNPGRPKILKILGCTPRQYYRLRGELIEVELISIESTKGGRKHSNQISLLLKDGTEKQRDKIIEKLKPLDTKTMKLVHMDTGFQDETSAHGNSLSSAHRYSLSSAHGNSLSSAHRYREPDIENQIERNQINSNKREPSPPTTQDDVVDLDQLNLSGKESAEKEKEKNGVDQTWKNQREGFAIHKIAETGHTDPKRLIRDYGLDLIERQLRRWPYRNRAGIKSDAGFFEHCCKVDLAAEKGKEQSEEDYYREMEEFFNPEESSWTEDDLEGTDSEEATRPMARKRDNVIPLDERTRRERRYQDLKSRHDRLLTPLARDFMERDIVDDPRYDRLQIEEEIEKQLRTGGRSGRFDPEDRDSIEAYVKERLRPKTEEELTDTSDLF